MREFVTTHRSSLELSHTVHATYSALVLTRTGSEVLFSDPVSESEDGSGCTPSDICRLENGTDGRTSLMIRRIPSYMTLDLFRAILDSCNGLRSSYDLLYVPILVNSARVNRGYAFINFKNCKFAAKFLAYAFKRGSPISDKLHKVDLVFAKLQGKEEMLVKILHNRLNNRKVGLPPGLYVENWE